MLANALWYIQIVQNARDAPSSTLSSYTSLRLSPEPSPDADTRAITSFGGMPPTFRHQYRFSRCQVDLTGSVDLTRFGELVAAVVQHSWGKVIGEYGFSKVDFVSGGRSARGEDGRH